MKRFICSGADSSNKSFRIKGGKKALADAALNKCIGIIVYKNGDWVEEGTTRFNYPDNYVAFTMSYDDSRRTYSQYIYKLDLKIKEFLENN